MLKFKDKSENNEQKLLLWLNNNYYVFFSLLNMLLEMMYFKSRTIDYASSY